MLTPLSMPPSRQLTDGKREEGISDGDALKELLSLNLADIDQRQLRMCPKVIAER